MRSQKVFQYERQLDTLIVTPSRDCLDVLESDLRREIESLHKLMETPGVLNVVVDVGHAPHFGSLIIGALMALCKKAHDRGGKSAFCNATDGMLDMLQIMKIDSVIPYFPERQQAINSVRKITR